jgi:hypothetical protein
MVEQRAGRVRLGSLKMPGDVEGGVSAGCIEDAAGKANREGASGGLGAPAL